MSVVKSLYHDHPCKQLHDGFLFSEFLWLHSFICACVVWLTKERGRVGVKGMEEGKLGGEERKRFCVDTE